MKKLLFKTLAKFNKAVLPSFGKKDLTKLSKWQKIVIGYRYYVTKNALDE